jgi:hypothetical protein
MNPLNLSDDERIQIGKEALEGLEAEGVFYKTGEFKRSEFTGEPIPIYRLVPHGKGPFEATDLIDQLHQAAEHFANVMLVVGWAKESKVEFIYPNETTRVALEKLNALVKRGGVPLGFIGLEEDGPYVNCCLKRFHPADDVINNYLLTVAQEQIRAGLQIDGFIVNSDN